MSKILELIYKKLTTKKKPESFAKIPDEDFIPYVCHLDPNTIITKNGELLQIIRVTGFSSTSVVQEIISLREAVRDSFKKNIKNENFAIWFNTLRRKKDISPRGEFEDDLSKEINQKWEEENNLKSEFVNELYITVIIQGVDSSVRNFNSIIRSFSKSSTRKFHHEKIKESHKELTEVVKNILNDIEEYGGKLIGLKKWKGVLYSQPMRFFGKLINLYEERYPLVANDISNDLASHKIAFGNRELEVIGYNNKNFAVLFSLKEYFEVNTGSLDRILQLPFEFIITQSFDFSYKEKDLEVFEYQDYLLQVSGDQQFRDLSGIQNFLESKTGNLTDFGKIQTTIMIIGKDQKQLELDVKLAIEEFSNFGFVLVREDIFLEHCFWSQLPANFLFLRRQKIINTNRIAGFSSLHSFPSGSIAGNHWGSAICALKTVLNTPFFFNFHEDDNGHTVVIGPKSSGKTLLINFLLAQSQKFKPKIFIFDVSNSSRCFVELSKGRYYDLANDDITSNNYLHLNPLSLLANSQNKEFLVEFFKSLVVFRRDRPSDQELGMISDIVDRIFAANINNFVDATEVFNNNETAKIYQSLKIWSEGKLKNIFNNQQDLDLSNKMNYFDFTVYQSQKPILIAIFLYLLHLIEINLDGSPSIIVLNQAFDFIGNQILSPMIDGILSRFRQKNCLIIFAFQDQDASNDPELAKSIVEYCATELYLPNAIAGDNHKSIFGLNNEELEIIRIMETHERHFLIKHAEESLIATLNFNNLMGYSKLMACNQEIIAVVKAIFADLDEKNKNPTPLSDALPIIIATIDDLENQKIQQQKEQIKQLNAKKRQEIKKKLEDD